MGDQASWSSKAECVRNKTGALVPMRQVSTRKANRDPEARARSLKLQQSEGFVVYYPSAGVWEVRH